MCGLVNKRQVTLLGLGEVGAVLAQDLKNPALSINSFDIAFANPSSKASTWAQKLDYVEIAETAAAAVQKSDLVISAVTAAEAINAAHSIMDAIPSSCWYWDINSVAPNTKCELAALLAGRARFVEGAVMSPIEPKRLAAPILLAGEYAQEFETFIHELGFSGARFFSEQQGKAAASKMCRSVMIKGMESLLTESLLSARYYGVEDQVLDSLNNLLPGIDWREHGAYMISRSLEHGVRRAEEMREVHKTVKEAGLLGLMSAACADTQAWTAELKQPENAHALLVLLDQLRAQIEKEF